MTKFQRALLAIVAEYPGITDRHLTDILLGKEKHPSQVNQETRLLSDRGLLARKKKANGRYGNFVALK